MRARAYRLNLGVGDASVIFRTADVSDLQAQDGTSSDISR
jgi:hypothetical protein